jgi:HSP20 family protein
MLTQWNQNFGGIEEMFSTMNQLRKYMDDVFEGTLGGLPWDGKALPFYSGSWPRTNVVDTGSNIVLTAEVPGFSEADINLTLTQNILQLSGERKLEAPDGYTVHRQERPALSFSRSFSLPSRVNAESATASVKNGILTITVEKAQEAMPRQITVKAQ